MESFELVLLSVILSIIHVERGNEVYASPIQGAIGTEGHDGYYWARGKYDVRHRLQSMSRTGTPLPVTPLRARHKICKISGELFFIRSK